MSYFKELEQYVREQYGVEGGTFKVQLVKPAWDGVKDGVRDGCSGWRMDEKDFIIKYIAYLDEMEKSGQTEFEIDRDVLWEQFSLDWVHDKNENLWSAIEEVVEDESNREFFCYFLNREDELEWDEVEDYIEHHFEQNTGWCAEYFDVSCEEFDDILSKEEEIEVDYIGVLHHHEDEAYEELEYITTCTSKK